MGKRPETVYKKGDMVSAKRPNTKQLPTKYRKHAELEQFFTAEIERVGCICVITIKFHSHEQHTCSTF